MRPAALQARVWIDGYAKAGLAPSLAYREFLLGLSTSHPIPVIRYSWYCLKSVGV